MKLKPGQNLEIGERRYRITRAKNHKLKCTMCQLHNKCIPCFNPDLKVDSKRLWSKKECNEKLKSDCYLYPI